MNRRGLTPEELQHLSILKRRAEHLQTRIDQSPKKLAYDEREVAALKWAMSRVMS